MIIIFKINELEKINFELTRKIQSFEKNTFEKPNDSLEIFNLKKENSKQNKTINELRFNNN